MTSQELEKLRNISLFDILGLKNNGRRQSIKCPFHKEKTASMMIYPNNTYKCYGCGVQGSGAISFLMESGASFRSVIEELNQIK